MVPKDEYKIHETKRDRSNEGMILSAFTRHLGHGYTFRRTAPLTGYDAQIFFHGKFVAIAEVTQRNVKWGHYSTVTRDTSKIDKLIKLANILKVRAFFLTSWSCGSMYGMEMNVDQLHYVKKWEQKRHDREEYSDTVYALPLRLFTNFRMPKC